MSHPLRTLLVTLVLSTLAAGTLTAGETEMTARQIMDEADSRHQVDSEVSEEIMILVDRAGKKEVRKLRKYGTSVPAPKGDEKLSRSLTVFVEPTNVKGTALLTWEQQGRDDDQWLYMPSQKKIIRIASGSKKGYFMGTDFTYEDMEPEKLDDYDYVRKPDETIDEQDCFVIEARPIKSKSRGATYKMRRLWVRKDIFFVVKVEYYGRRDKLLKRLTNSDLFAVEGIEGVWRARKTLMDNIARKHKTLKGTKDWKINTEIADEIFTERYLLTEKHLR